MIEERLPGINGDFGEQITLEDAIKEQVIESYGKDVLKVVSLLEDADKTDSIIDTEELSIQFGIVVVEHADGIHNRIKHTREAFDNGSIGSGFGASFEQVEEEIKESAYDISQELLEGLVNGGEYGK